VSSTSAPFNLRYLHPVACVRSGDGGFLYPSTQHHYRRLILLLCFYIYLLSYLVFIYICILFIIFIYIYYIVVGSFERADIDNKMLISPLAGVGGVFCFYI
jgi:hypothetical protein